MISALSSALAGLNTASAQVNNAAAQVTQSGGDDLTAAVGLMQGETSYKADIAVMKMTEDMQNQLVHLFDKVV